MAFFVLAMHELTFSYVSLTLAAHFHFFTFSISSENFGILFSLFLIVLIVVQYTTMEYQ